MTMEKEIASNPNNLGKTHKESFRDILLNGPLEPYADELYGTYELYNVNPTYLRHIENDKEQIANMIGRCREIVVILQDIREGKVCWRNEVFTDLKVPFSVETFLQKDLEQLIRGTKDKTFFSAKNSMLIEDAIQAKWQDVTRLLPDSEVFHYDNMGRLTNDSFSNVKEKVEESFSAVGKLFTWTNELMISAFLDGVRHTGVKLDNAVYREVYKCLRFFSWIDYDQMESHRKTTSKYVKENFIKQKFNRLDNNGIDWMEFIADVIDEDFINPRK